MRTTRLPACSMRSAMLPAPAVVDADDRGAVRLHAGDQARLHGRVMRKRAVAIDDGLR